jgi:pyruvate/2-oxoglutarate dehydrogenase complex dihydrolipoamide dehydrogenase (E3) component
VVRRIQKPSSGGPPLIRVVDRFDDTIRSHGQHRHANSEGIANGVRTGRPWADDRRRTETEAPERGVEVEVAAFPWAASGRALGIGRPEGRTKLVLEPGTRRILGAGIVGVNAGDLISETVLAREMGADAEDVALTVHPHPTLSETVAFSAEWAEGTITDLYRRPR